MSGLLIKGGTVLLPAGGGFHGPLDVLCTGGLVQAVAAGLEPGPEVEVVDAGGKFVLPGLVDAHFHIVSRSAESVDDQLVALGAVEGAVNAAQRLRGGVTSVRDCGCRHHGIHSVVAAIEAGLIDGPRIFAAGRNPTTSLAPAHWRNVTADGPEAMAAAVDAEIDAGAHWVKFIVSHASQPWDWADVAMYLGEAELSAAVAAAHARGVRTGAHVEGWAAAALAVRCGVGALDHAPLLSSPVVEDMAVRGTVYVPTVWAFSADAGIDERTLEATNLEALEHWRAEHRASVLRAHRAGVVVAAGSDAAGTLPAHDVLVQEMSALVECGLSTMEALVAATEGSARALGQQSRLGCLAAGAAADVVVVDADPAGDLTVLGSPTLVVSRGTVLWPPRGQLDARASEDRRRATAELAGVVERWAAPVLPAEPSTDAPAPSFDDIVADLLARTGATRATVRLCRPDGGVELVSEALAPLALSMFDGPKPAVTVAATYQYLERERAILVQDDILQSRYAAPPSLVSHYGVRAQMLAPVFCRDRMAATISVHQAGGPRVWTPEDVEALVQAQKEVAARLGS